MDLVVEGVKAGELEIAAAEAQADAEMLRDKLARRFGTARFTLADLWFWTGSHRQPATEWNQHTRGLLTGCPGVVAAEDRRGAEGWRVSYAALRELAGGRPMRLVRAEPCPFPPIVRSTKTRRGHETD